MSQNEIEKNKHHFSVVLNTGAKKLDIIDISNEKISEKEKYKKVADLIRIWEQEEEQNSDKNWDEFEKVLEESKIQINSNK